MAYSENHLLKGELMSATKTRVQKPKSYEARIAKSRANLKALKRKPAPIETNIESSIIEKYFN
jgi:hypothetical protein